MMIDFFSWPDSLPPYIENISLIVILILAIICSLKIAISSSLVNIIVLSTSLSLLMSITYLLLGAPDVSITEASIGACITSVILLLSLTYVNKTTLNSKIDIKAFLVCLICVISLIYGCNDLPLYGDINSPTQGELYHYYIEKSGSEIGVFATAAAILANYRGYDTLAETAVIFTAAIAILLIFGNLNQKDKADI